MNAPTRNFTRKLGCSTCGRWPTAEIRVSLWIKDGERRGTVTKKRAAVMAYGRSVPHSNLPSSTLNITPSLSRAWSIAARLLKDVPLVVVTVLPSVGHSIPPQLLTVAPPSSRHSHLCSGYEENPYRKICKITHHYDEFSEPIVSK